MRCLCFWNFASAFFLKSARAWAAAAASALGSAAAGSGVGAGTVAGTGCGVAARYDADADGAGDDVAAADRFLTGAGAAGCGSCAARACERVMRRGGDEAGSSVIFSGRTNTPWLGLHTK